MSSSTQDQPPPRKRHRIAESCKLCRSKKTRCDGRRPTCSSCQDKNTTCEYNEPNVLLSSDILSKIADLEARVQALEGSPGNFPGRLHVATSPSPRLSGHGSGQSSIVDNPTLRFISSVTQTATPGEGDIQTQPRSTNDHATSFDRMNMSQVVLPPREVADDFVECYERSVYPYFPVLHMPSFKAKYLVHDNTTCQLPQMIDDEHLLDEGEGCQPAATPSLLSALAVSMKIFDVVAEAREVNSASFSRALQMPELIRILQVNERLTEIEANLPEHLKYNNGQRASSAREKVLHFQAEVVNLRWHTYIPLYQASRTDNPQDSLCEVTAPTHKSSSNSPAGVGTSRTNHLAVTPRTRTPQRNMAHLRPERGSCTGHTAHKPAVIFKGHKHQCHVRYPFSDNSANSIICSAWRSSQSPFLAYRLYYKGL
ncbi:hypothetical protein FGADI_2151 [Fusarium gaditjirri]|uniref:Zn(2)-C6 fungal-type domain-containing protein n=1 Tax=Fusarium gaditjirri TaxID=282569 RepID=A0A8H4TJ21_9HYPO|nr:hypothetical protein FGADI_2151 [Fusarium gaditjirri]